MNANLTSLITYLNFFLNFKDKELVGQAVYFLQEKVLRLSLYLIWYFLIGIVLTDFQVIATDFNNESLESLRQEAVNENLDIKVIFVVL